MSSGGGSAASACVLCLYFAGLFLSAAATEGATHANTALVPRTTPHGRGILSKATSGLLLVGKIDGSISAVDEDSGKIMWTFDSGSPLISTSQDPASNVQVFPGIDGSIYVLHDNQSPKLELSRVTVSELVENSPSVTADGSAIRGSLSTTLYYIDSVSGKLLRSVSDVEHSGVESAAEDLDDAAILIARKDYKVQSFDRTLSSARWSISFAEIHYLDTTPVNAQNAVMEYVRGKQESLPCPSCGPSLTTGEDNSLHAKDPATGWNMWSVSFTSAPVVAFSLNKAGQSILQWDTYLSEGSSGVATDLWKTKGHSKNPRVLVGSVASGGLYALPLSSQSAHALTESEQGSNPGDKKLVELIESRDTDEADCLGSLKCVVLEVADTSEQNEPFPWLPEASKETMLSETFDNRLFLLGAFVALAISGGAFAVFMRMRRQQPEPLQPLQHIKKLRQSSGTSTSSINALQSLSASTKASLTSWSNTGFDNWGLMDVKGQVFTVGQLTFGPSVLGWGSDGTVVFDGEFHGRPVAVKRILKTFYDMAANEKDILIISDEHPNLVRLFAVEEDQDFVFLALERCKMSLSEYIRSEEGQSTLTGPEGLPSAVCYQIARGVCEGLAALHSRGVVHRDLKPHNVLMSEHGRAKLSDMGLCRRMVPNQTSFFSNGPGGSSGWQAPEQLIIRDGRALRQTKAMDIFSLGCIMYHCISKGRHPFGECSYKRDDNILKSTPHLDAVDNCPEAMELISTMLEKDPQNRPTIEEVMEHPFWWNERQKLQFLIELSDRMENEDRQEDKTLIRSFESVAAKATGGNWGARLDPLLVTNLGQYRKYTFTSLRDLLRVVRNKHNHFRELPADLKTQMGPVPEGFYLYFAKRFPDLLMTTYSFAKENLSTEPPMDKYFVNTLTRKSSNADSVSTPSSMPTIDEEMNAGLSSKKSNEDLTDMVDDEIERDGSPRLKVRTKPPNPVIRTVSMDSAVSGGSSARGTWDTVLNVIRENVDKNNAEQEGGLLRGQSLGSNYSPIRMTDQVTPKTGTEAGCVSSRTQPRSPNYHPRGFNSLINTERETRAEIDSKKETDPYRELQSPIKLSSGSKKYEVPNRPIVGWEEDPDNENYTLLPFPQRPGAPVCDFYQKTGFCKYHERCRYHHPPESAVRLNEDGLPIRTGETICEFYKNTHNCKFGGACKFNHPNMKPIYAGSVGNHSNSQRSPY